MSRVIFTLALATLPAATTAEAAVYRCMEPDGSVTYQDRACRGDASGATDIPTEFPPPNEAERARILQREALLEQRLEQKRERESREAALRSVSAPAPAPAPAAEPYVEGYPLFIPFAYPRPMPRPHVSRPHPPRSGGINAARP